MTDLAAIAAAYRVAQDDVDAAKVTARKVVAEAQENLAARRQALAEAIAEAARAGVRQREIIAATGLSREWVRQTLRAQGIGPDD
jgi:hypothetical protein